jgi:hypothetical protein
MSPCPAQKGLKSVNSSLEPSTLTTATNNNRLPREPKKDGRYGNGNGNVMKRRKNHLEMAPYTASSFLALVKLTETDG